MTSPNRNAIPTPAAPPATAPETALAKVSDAHIVSHTDFRDNPSPSAILALIDPDMPVGAIVLGKDPWTDYLKIDEGVMIAGEVVAVVKRYEADDAGVITPRFLLILRTTRAEQMCQRKYDATTGENPRGKLREEKVDGFKKIYDEYPVPPGTLVATNLRTIMKPLIPLARRIQAHEVFIKVLARVQAKRDKKQSYWDMKLATLPLDFSRDDSLDHLSAEADQIMNVGGESDLPGFVNTHAPPAFPPARSQQGSVALAEASRSVVNRRFYLASNAG